MISPELPKGPELPKVPAPPQAPPPPPPPGVPQAPGLPQAPAVPKAPQFSAPTLGSPPAPPSPFYSAEETPESPKPPTPHWRGVSIAAPAQIALGAKAPVAILRGTYRIQGDKYPSPDTLVIHAIDMASKKEYQGAAGQQDSSPVGKRPASAPPNPETIKRMVFTGHFNTDLILTLKLPIASATYKVRADLGNIQSNEITLRIIVQ